MDTNESYLRTKVAGYLSVILRGFETISMDDLLIIRWILPADHSLIAKFLIDLIGTVKPDVLEACNEDPSCFPETLSSYLKVIGLVKTRKFEAFILERLNQTYPEITLSCTLETHMQTISQLFNLSPSEVEVLWFFYINDVVGQCSEYFELHLGINMRSMSSTLCHILDITATEMERVINGSLFTLNLLEKKSGFASISNRCSEYISLGSNDALLNELYVPFKGKAISLGQHQIKSEQTDHIIRLLKSDSPAPVHILIYGKPGTGKSSYTLGLAEEVGISAWEIVNGDKDNPDCRRMAISACLNVNSRGTDALVVVDEADNILNSSDVHSRPCGTMDKAWLNQLLERPNIRMIWIVNSISGIEESVMRRFAYSLEFKSQDETRRCNLWKNILSNNQVKFEFDDDEIRTLARTYKLNAGSIDIAVKHAMNLKYDTKPPFLTALHMGLESQERLIHGHSEKKRRDENLADLLTIEGLCISRDPHEVEELVKRFESLFKSGSSHRSMNMLFYGPPGTGKTALAKHLANVAERPLVCKSASDILSCWVGGSERNIADAFAEAEEGVLVFDEVDTFLCERGMAKNSWEVSLVNEFLTQIENYSGILICTTNRLDGLDKAALRRFTFKLGFDYLKPEGVMHFYHRYFSQMIQAHLNDDQNNRLRSLRSLAPGDFKVVKDCFEFAAPRSHDELIDALIEEIKIKSCDKKRMIGFI